MKRFIAAIAVTATALTGTSAFAESTIVESQKKLEKAFAADDLSSRQTSRSNDDNFITRTFGALNFSFIDSDRISQDSNWGNGFRGGRIHPPAGR